MYDLIIIGAGPAGITAAVYAARKAMNMLVLTLDIGGQASTSGDIQNYTGYQFISGPELALKFEEHMRAYKIPVHEREYVISVEAVDNMIRVSTVKGVYKARCLIIASGKKSRSLNVPGEEQFKNKGLTYCATCDGPIFKGKPVAVIGAGNSALDAALQLVRIASKVYIVNSGEKITGDAIMLEALQKEKNAEVLNNSKVIEIMGDKFVNSVRINNSGIVRDIPAEGVFVEIGLLPNSDFINCVDKNSLGEIKVDRFNKTSVPGIFAAGDVTDVAEKQIIIAAGEGAKAVLSAFRYLTGAGS
ncbi:MAG: FAD-dependent oxidoreductase [Candidatus Omnitrophica bacterium]|jgi:alkyl hydroperoxide reductase subunit F|nr:FAD-dependent oxidoreductase [Candidatus Omnitrophota bacterium]